jgi:hypothetical protein
MRELEKQIAEWRRRMAAAGVKPRAVLDELESHLREEIQARVSAGDSDYVAFETAAARIGSAGALRTEFNKISGAVSSPVLISASLWIGAVILTLVVISGRLVSGRMGLLLFTHVLAVTAGYLAAFLSGSLAAYYICCRWAGRLTPASQQSLSRAVARFTWISCVLSVIGFLLGMLWGHKHLGAAWTNDPREFGGVGVCLWFGVLWLAHASGKVSENTRMLLNIVGNMIVAQAWFGGWILAHNPAMHWYGLANYLPLQLFMGAHVLFLFMGFSRKIETAET